MILGFKKQFVHPIQSGTKIFTMRKRRKVRPKLGETLHMYTGLRTKKCELITNKKCLVSIQNARVLIEETVTGYTVRVYVDGRHLSEMELRHFAMNDGFQSVEQFCRYWLQIPGKKTLKKRTAALMEMYHWTSFKY